MISIINVTVMTAMNSVIRIDYLKNDVQRVKFFPPSFSDVTLNEYVSSITGEDCAPAVVAESPKKAKKEPVPVVQQAPVQPVVKAAPAQVSALPQLAPQPEPVQAAPVQVQPVQAAPVQPTFVPPPPPVQAQPVQPPPPPAQQPVQAHVALNPIMVPLISTMKASGAQLTQTSPAKVAARDDDAHIAELYSQGGKVDEETAKEEAREVCASREPIAALSARIARWPESLPPEIPGYSFLRVKDGKLPAENDNDKAVRSIVLAWIQEAIGTHKDAKLTADAIAIMHKVNMLVATSGYPIMVNGTPSLDTKGWYIHTLQTYMSQWMQYVKKGMEEGILATQAPKNLFEQVNPDHTVKYPANAAPFDGWMQGKLPA